MNALLEISQLAEESALAMNRRSDRIKREVREGLASTQHSELRSVTCEFEHGLLQLFGQVDSYYLKQLAQEHARHVDGVTHIINSIHVSDPAHPNRMAAR